MLRDNKICLIKGFFSNKIRKKINTVQSNYTEFKWIYQQRNLLIKEARFEVLDHELV